MKKQSLKKICTKCFGECPIDKEKSNKKWIVYQNIEKCVNPKCDGKYRLGFINYLKENQ